MLEIFIDIIIILSLILLNGFFSAAEIAILTLRNSELQRIIKSQRGSALKLEKLKENPERLIATIQIGITLISTFASAYGGAKMLGHIMPYLSEVNIPLLDAFKNEIAFLTLVLLISYFSLLLGELIPKSFALSYSSQVSQIVAYPLYFFSIIFKTFINILTFSSDLILRLFNKDSTSFAETRLHEDEIRFLLQEGVQAGSIADSEHEIINNIFEINDKTAREIMTPRVNMEAIKMGATEEEIQRVVIHGKRSHIPVYRQDLDNIEGLLDVKEFMRARATNNLRNPESMLHPVFNVPEGMKLDKILKEMQKQRNYMAIVIDEYGGTSGLITLEDILEEIVGDIIDKDDQSDAIMVHRVNDRVAIVNGACPIHEFNKNFREMPIPESDAYNSVAGFVIESIGRFPEVGEKISLRQFQFELLKRVRQRLHEFRLSIVNPEEKKNLIKEKG